MNGFALRLVLTQRQKATRKLDECRKGSLLKREEELIIVDFFLVLFGSSSEKQENKLLLVKCDAYSRF